MSRVNWVTCCAVIALAVGVLPRITVAQNDDPFGNGAVDLGQLVAPEPTPAIDPAPADENSLLTKTEAATAAPQDLCRCVGDDTTARSVVNIRKALRQPLKDAGIDYSELPLEEAVGQLQEEYGIPIKLDTAALDDIGVQPDKPVTVNLHGISLRAALRLMLKELGLTYVIKDEVLMITTPDEAEKQLRTCVYDVRDLRELTKVGGLKKLVDTIAACVATETWAVNGGGEAEIRPLEPGLLVISQTQLVHDEVRDLLDTIREVYARRAAGGATSDAAAGFVSPVADDAQKVVTRSYLLQINQPAGSDSLAKQVRELITLSLPDEQWAGRLDDGQPVVLTVLPDRVVLRHREAVQDKVQSLLQDTAIAYPATGVAGGGRGGFGGGGGGFGGGEGGGGFVNPERAENQ